MKALLKLGVVLTLFSNACVPVVAQDIGIVQLGKQEAVHPAVALEMRIQTLVDTLGISGEQEPSFRVAMGQVQELEMRYLQHAGQHAEVPANDSAMVDAAEKLLALVLYPTQISAFRELELEHLWQSRTGD